MVILLFGVMGAGKSLIGSRLAAELGWKFYDADMLHSPANLEKMKRGVPLTDEDRGPWLDELCALLQSIDSKAEGAVLACSALKESYRQRLLLCGNVKLVFLTGEYALIRGRLEKRKGHFMDIDLLGSQFETLEEPPPGTLVINVELAPEQIVKRIRQNFKV
jgi:gluconokinase